MTLSTQTRKLVTLPYDLGGVADAKIKGVVLGHVGAVDVVDRAASYVLPVEVEEGASPHRKVILGKNVGLVIGDPDEVLLFVAATPVSVSFGFSTVMPAVTIRLSKILPESMASAP